MNEPDCSMYEMCMRFIGKPPKGSVYLDEDGKVDLNCQSCCNIDVPKVIPNE